MFEFDKYIDPTAFFIALAIGLFITYVMAPPKRIVVKWPTPHNSGKVIYKDHADNCYTYKHKEVQCPTDTSKITFTNLQYAQEEKKENSMKDTIVNILDFDKKSN